ncbi:hypothetical protein F7734_23320 [Scytonema sp. UIC 10036]|uniref:hypothetical protein n=1 Tax=Scytonema sp. UIC 10036 TaxID=2304196 RepID=UPI0012DA335F|nr:hypothetical protein [Scytonema sp. UIC 10036]MUG95131.1 hypothetical protein [Scytonema sp. UIC 10036]
MLPRTEVLESGNWDWRAIAPSLIIQQIQPTAISWFSIQVHLSNRHRVTPFQLTSFDL